jgi:hypothetical protein
MRYIVILLTISSLAIAQKPPKPVGGGFGVTRGLVLHLAFDKAGKQILDKSPQKNNATVHNAKFVAKGRVGGAYKLDGRGDYLRIANSASIEVRHAVTVAVWVKLDSFGPKGYANENGYIVNKGDDYWWNPALGLGFSKGGQNALFHVGSPGARRNGIKSVRGVTKLQIGKWYHLAGTYDGKTSSIYVNGKLEKSMPLKGLMRADKAPVLLGGGHLGSGEFGNQFTVTGTIDDVMIWNRALSADEVRSIAVGTPVGVPHISREAKLDRVVLRDGNIFKGEITNKSYVVTTSQGKIEIPAAAVIGLVSEGPKDKTIRLVLNDSQVIRGTLDGQKLTVNMGGSKLNVAFDGVVQCGYRITSVKPSDLNFTGTMASLRDGQRLLLARFDMKLQIKTEYCTTDLPAGSILKVTAADGKRLGHVLTLSNGSKLTGVLVPKTWTAGLTLGGKRKIAWEDVLAMASRGVKPVKPTGGVTIKMYNGDILHGKLTAKAIGIQTEFGEISPDAKSITSIAVDAVAKPLVVMKMRSGAVHRGQFANKQLSLALLAHGPTLKISTAKIASITWK